MKTQDTNGPWQKAGQKIFEKIGQGFVLGLLGISGVGKTQIGANLVDQCCRNGDPAVFISAFGLLVRIRSSFGPAAKETEQQVVDAFIKPKLLVIDEMEARGNTPWEDTLIRHIIDQRYGALVDTLLISNLDQKSFSENLGPSVVSRMNETGGIVFCDWPSFRK